MTETILITGASGNIGSEVIRQLTVSNKKPNLRVVAHSRASDTMKDDRLERVEMDYDKLESIANALKNVDRIFLLTPTHPSMIEFTSNLANAAKKTQGQIKHIVKLSHIRANAQPGITITRLHREAEKVLEDSGIPFTFLRPNFFMQNFVNLQAYGQMIKSQGFFSLSAGDGRVSFVDVRDIASVAAKALEDDSHEHTDKAYDITGPEAISYGEAAEILSSEAGKKINYVNISDEDTRTGMKAMGLTDWNIDIVLELLRITREGYLSDTSSAVEKVTGKKPISFVQFAKDYVHNFLG